MAPLKILICGGGVGGPALAFWLAKAGHQITIVENYKALRATGAQIDIRAQGIQVVKKMGLLETIRKSCVQEDGVAIVDSQNRRRAVVLANKSGKGAQSLTSEYEIMRGDLVRILYDATASNPNITYLFNKSVASYTQTPSSVTATFSDTSTSTYDLLIGADGQNSTIRKQMLPANHPDPLRHFHAYLAYWFVPRDSTDSSVRRSYAAPGNRLVMTRSHSPTTSQAYLFFKSSDPSLINLHKLPFDEKKAIWEEKFRDAGWQTERFLKGMRDESNEKNVYFQELVQVRIAKWYDGRVGLMGDAAHCASPLSGMGTTGAFVGAYVLAGEINRLREGEDVGVALERYQSVLKPFVDGVQNQSFKLLEWGMWESWWAIEIMRWIFTVVCFLRIPDLVSRFSSPNKGGWVLPDYEEGKKTQ